MAQPKYTLNQNLTRVQEVKLDENLIILDTETTGFGRSAEVLQLGMIDGTGKVLWDELYDTVWTPTWEQAEEIHGISPEMVSNEDPIWVDMPEIRALLEGKSLAIFNAVYDSTVMPDGLTSAKEKLCIMNAFKHHTQSKKYNLILAAESFADYTFPEEDRHTAVGDCKATLAVLRWLQDTRDSLVI